MATLNDLLFSYSVLNANYQSALVKEILATGSAVGDIGNPQDTFVPVEPGLADPKLFAYAYGQSPAILLAKVITEAGSQPSACAYTLAAPKAGGGQAWKLLARDVVLQWGGRPAATNPYGAAQADGILYLIDYDSRKLFPLGVNELNGLPAGNHPLSFDPIDLGALAGLPPNAKGQAIIALKNSSGTTYLYALYTVADINKTPYAFDNSFLVRVALISGSVAEVIKAELGSNAQDIITADDGSGLKLLIPSIGGSQNPGETNQTNSRLDMLDPFAVVSATGSWNVTTLITGEPVPAGAVPAYWDFRAAAASSTAAADSWVFILTATMNSTYQMNWTLYKGEAAAILGITATMTLSAAVTNGKIEEVASGTGAPGYFWDIFYENTGTSATDRLWFLRGSPIEIHDPGSYSTAVKIFERGTAANQIGGDTVDSAVLVAETMRQAALGVSLKRGLRGVAPALPPAEEDEETQK